MATTHGSDETYSPVVDIDTKSCESKNLLHNSQEDLM